MTAFALPIAKYVDLSPSIFLSRDIDDVKLTSAAPCLYRETRRVFAGGHGIGRLNLLPVARSDR
jgi:hypothetical protein